MITEEIDNSKTENTVLDSIERISRMKFELGYLRGYYRGWDDCVKNKAPITQVPEEENICMTELLK
jgi:hypothetical protein